jgi:hypothetical protein
MPVNRRWRYMLRNCFLNIGGLRDESTVLDARAFPTEDEEHYASRTVVLAVVIGVKHERKLGAATKVLRGLTQNILREIYFQPTSRSQAWKS